MTVDLVVFPFDHLMVLVETVETPWAGGVPASAAIAPVPVHPERVWLVELPERDVQVSVRGDRASNTPWDGASGQGGRSGYGGTDQKTCRNSKSAFGETKHAYPP